MALTPSRNAVAVSLFALALACGGESETGTAHAGGAAGASGAVGAGGSKGGSSSGGSSTSGGTSGTSGGSTGTSGGSGATSGSGGATSAGCPETTPTNGDPCTPPYESSGFGAAVHCSYGDDPRPQCRTTAFCSNDAWEVTEPNCESPPLPAACPETPPSDTTTCSDATLSCWYDDGTRCWCSGCSGGSGYPVCQTIDPPEWYCGAPSSDCPTVIPQAGTPCSTPDASCGADCSLPVTCTDGVWLWGGDMCPICAAPNTPIATPEGERSIASLHSGDLVYSVDHDAIVAVPLLRVGRTPVALHHVVRVVLEDGRVLEISPGHPTADGRTFGDLLAGGALDAQHSIISAEVVPYAYDATYDILPASSTGTYFAAGALIGSTLFRR